MKKTLGVFVIAAALGACGKKNGTTTPTNKTDMGSATGGDTYGGARPIGTTTTPPPTTTGGSAPTPNPCGAGM